MLIRRDSRTHTVGLSNREAYSPLGRLMGKYRNNNSVTLSASVDMVYGYCDDYQPHAMKRMFDYENDMLLLVSGKRL